MATCRLTGPGSENNLPPPPPPLCTRPAFLAEDGRGAKSNLYRDFLNFLLLQLKSCYIRNLFGMKRIYPISRHRGMNTHQCDEFLNAAVMLTYPDPPFFVPPPSYECGGHWQMLHLVYCPASGVSTEFEKPDNRMSARPPRPPGWGRQASGLRTPQTIRVHWTELYPGHTERQYGTGDIWISDLSLSLSLIRRGP